jgi:TonB-like protein
MFSTDVGGASLPGRGLFLSVLFHCIFVLVTLVIPWSYWMPSDAHLVMLQDQARTDQALLLPDLQPMGSQSAPAPAAAPSERKQSASRRGAEGTPSAIKAVHGVVHEGPQIILSNPPHPDNFSQTILQPELPAAELPRPLAIPPMVSVARSTPALQTPPPLQAPPSIPEPAPPALAPPVAVLPMSASQQLPKVDAPKLPLPESEPKQHLSAVAGAPVPSALPKLARAPVPMASASGDAAHSILVIDADPISNIAPAELPPGELHGAFTVAPSGMIASNPKDAPGAGTGTGNVTGLSSAIGTTPGAGSGAGTGTATATGVGSGTGTAPGIGGGGVVNGTGTGTVAGVPGGTGVGTSAARGSGAGQGIGSGRGAGAGTGTGSSPFAGITIQGGSGNSGHRSTVPATGRNQTSYDVTIVASGASGGGFKDYGIFRQGASYTVYLDMTDVGLRSDWPLQYAPYTGPGVVDPPLHGALEAPYALTKTLPTLSADAARRSHGGTIVVYGVINQEGHWEQLRVMQSPDPAFTPIVMEALAKWNFKPAQAQGSAVAVKCLLGLPVYSLAGD